MSEAKIEFEEKKAQEADVAITRLIDKGILKSVSYGPPAIPAAALHLDYCRELAKNKGITGKYYEDEFVKVCSVLKEVAESNKVVLSLKEMEIFNSTVKPAIKYVVESEFGD